MKRKRKTKVKVEMTDSENIEAGVRMVDLNVLVSDLEKRVRGDVAPQTMLNRVLGAAVCRVRTAPEVLEGVMEAMLARALHTTGRGSVTFGYESRPDEIYIYVRDTGEGFGPDHDPWRDDAALAECAAGVAGLGGAYGSESAGVGKGALLWLTVPGVAEDNDETSDDDEVVSPVMPVARRDGKPLVLVAEDNESNYLLFSSILEDDYDLAHARDGREAVDMFAELNPDLVLMDISMPHMDGYEATSNIRRLSAEVPIIAVTAYAFASDRTRILESGFNSYISKPLNAAHLMAEMERWLIADK